MFFLFVYTVVFNKIIVLLFFFCNVVICESVSKTVINQIRLAFFWGGNSFVFKSCFCGLSVQYFIWASPYSLQNWFWTEAKPHLIKNYFLVLIPIFFTSDVNWYKNPVHTSNTSVAPCVILLILLVPAAAGGLPDEWTWRNERKYDMK